MRQAREWDLHPGMTRSPMCLTLAEREHHTGMAMATNKKKLLITQSMAKVGWDLLRERGDIEPVQFPGTITTPDFRALLTQHAPVNGGALGITPFGQGEIAAARGGAVVGRVRCGRAAVRRR